VLIITGGNAGIGFENSKAVLQKNGKLYLAARSAERAQAAIAKLKEITSKEAIFLPLDLADLRSVKKAAEEFLSKQETLDYLFLNAGVMNTPLDVLTAQGYDAQFGTNVLGHCAFNQLLMPALLKSYETNAVKPRVIVVSSQGHGLAPPGKTGIEWDTMKPGPVRDKVWNSFPVGGQLYGQSKLGNILWAQWLHRHYGDKIVAISLHPGTITSELMKHNISWLFSTWTYFLSYKGEFGALTQLWAGFSPEAADLGGGYAIPWGRPGNGALDKRALNIDTQEKLVEWVNEQTKGFL